MDLIIAGDLIEFWQPPAGLECKGVDSDLGCNTDELSNIALAITKQHDANLRILGEFAGRGSNHIHVIPGNHDAALLLPKIWRIFHAATRARSGRVSRVDSGVWVSPDGKVVVEHGHQIGSDVNRFANWPEITRISDGRIYAIRTWGERFVQRIFNAQESTYPTIDNLSPESAGVKYRIADRGFVASAADIARFIAFNLFETSLLQKSDFLGKSESEVITRDDVKVGRTLGHKLFLEALQTADPLRQLLMAKTAESDDIRAELDRLAIDESRLPDSEVELLCAQLAIRSDNKLLCREATASYVSEKLFRSKRAVIKSHLQTRISELKFQRMSVFVYAHTHSLEKSWPLQVTDMREVHVLNSGAFQRVTDEEGFVARAKLNGWTEAEALSKLPVESLPPCYTSVLISLGEPVPTAKTVRWHMEEDGVGRFVDVGDSSCE